MAYIQEREQQDGSISFRVQVRLKGFPMQTASFSRKTDAKKWGQQTEAAIREGRHFKTSAAKKHILSEVIDRYMHDILPMKPKSEKKQRAQLIWWKEQLGDYSLADLTSSLIAEKRDFLAKGITYRGDTRSPATVVRYLAALSHACTIAVKEWGWLESNPVLKITKPREARGRVRFLSDEERKRLLETTKKSKSPFLHLAFVFAISTGARKSEIFNLQWKNVDLHRGVITLHETKNGERRVLPLKGYALELLKKHASVRRIDSNLVFPSSDPARPVDVRAAWEKALKEADISDYKWHDNRHSAASYLAMNGASLAEIAEVLGHKTLQMVKRYAHLSDAHTAKVVERMNEKIFG